MTAATPEPCHVIRIDVDGTVKRFPPHVTTPMLESKAEFDQLTSVVTLRPGREGFMLIGVIHDMGVMNRMPINVKAWFMYGRSPICGPMYVVDDDQQPLPEDLLTAVESAGFPGPDAEATMRDWLAHNDQDGMYVGLWNEPAPRLSALYVQAEDVYHLRYGAVTVPLHGREIRTSSAWLTLPTIIANRFKVAGADPAPTAKQVRTWLDEAGRS